MREQSKIVVVGMGEMGKSLYELLSEHYDSVGVDISPVKLNQPVDVMHVCYPFQIKDFIGETARYIDLFKPSLTIINSTVAIGTTRLIAERTGAVVVNSPVRGKHDGMLDDLRSYTKFVGAMDIVAGERAAKHFAAAGLKTKILSSPEATELAKLTETAYFGLMIAWAQEVKGYCDQLDQDYDEVISSFQEIKSFPPVKYLPGAAGDRSLIPNIKMLSKLGQSSILEAIEGSNHKMTDRGGERGAALVPVAAETAQVVHDDPPVPSTALHLRGKRVAMVLFSSYPEDTRPRRAVDALLKEGMSVDLICLGNGKAPAREVLGRLNILRLRINHRRDSKLVYAYNYSAFILVSASILALRSLARHYDLVYVHNMPDILVLSSMVPKLLGAKVILDLHDPMPELMTTIFNLDKDSLIVRLVQQLEKWSIARANLVLTVSSTFKRVFTARSCPPEKMGIVMNSPDDKIFPFRTPRSYPPARSVPAKRFVIMYHGSLLERNGLDLAVDALDRVRNAVPAAELRIYGFRTPFLDKVLDAARIKGLEDRVHYLGPRSVEDMGREIEDCDVGIVPNHRNAFTDINTPTRIFEYLALGKPTIAPRTLGIQDYFSPDSLIFFESGNAEDLARMIEYVAFHYEEAIEIAERGQSVYLMHTWSKERRTLVNLVYGLLNGKQLETIPAGRGYSENRESEELRMSGQCPRGAVATRSH